MAKVQYVPQWQYNGDGGSGGGLPFMKRLSIARWPVFEFSIFLVVVLIGWAEFQLYNTVKPQVLEAQKELRGAKLLGAKWEQNARVLQQNVNALNLESD